MKINYLTLAFVIDLINRQHLWRAGDIDTRKTLLARCKCAGKQSTRLQFMTFDSKQEALSSRFEESKYYISLNGTWNFYYGWI